MYLAKLIRGQDKPIVTEVCSYEWGVEVLAGAERVVKRPRAPWARKTRTGAAALSHTPSGAIASARVLLSSTAETQ